MELINLISNCLTSYATVGDIVTYNITCNNASNISFDNIFICNNLNSNLKFIPSSVIINNIERPDLDILSGFSVGKLGISKKINIKFDAKIISNKYSTINVTTSAECIYTEEKNTKSMMLISNSLVYVYDPNIYISKSVDKEKVSLNDTVTYTIKLVNNGDISLDKIILKDNICESLQIIEDSLSVNSNIVHGADLKKGLNVGSLPIDDLIVIKYDAKVIGQGIACRLTNEAFVDYTYYLDNGSVGTKQSEIASCNIYVSLPSFKQICLEEYVNLPNHKEDILSIENINTDIIIKNHHSIKTPIATSNEGIVLSGYKLIIHGTLSQIVRYSAKKSNNAIHSLEYEIPFSTFIILPTDYRLGSKIQIDCKEEYTHFSLVNSRCIFESVNVILIAKTLS